MATVKPAHEETALDRLQSVADWKNDDMKNRMVRHPDLVWLLNEYHRLKQAEAKPEVSDA